MQVAAVTRLFAVAGADAEMFGQKQTATVVVHEAFRKIDTDNSGYIDADEVRSLFRRLALHAFFFFRAAASH